MSRRVVVLFRQNATDGCGLGDESHDFHLGTASTGQRVDVVDFIENRHRNGGEPEVLAEQNRDDRLTGQHEHASENPAGAREKKEKEP